MEHFIYPLLIVLAIGGGFWANRKLIVERARLKREREALEREREILTREREAIEGEERRMFNFLHGLGETLQDDHSPPNMHRYIVDGIANVVGADAGILYLLDNDTRHLVPVYQTGKTAPVLPTPREILEIADLEEADAQYRSYLRLSALVPGQSLIGQVLEENRLFHVPDLMKETEFSKEPRSVRHHDGVSLLATTLLYAHKPVGVLAVTRSGERPFSSNDVEVFESVAEQGSYALGSAVIHVEAAEKRRYERELTQASDIQRVLLPRSAPALSDYEIAAEYRAARHVSGDYFDYVRVDEDRYGIAIGDVSGKGIAASLIMAMCRSNLRSRAPENLSPASVLHSVNHSIFPDIREDMFVSLLYLIVERGSKEVTLARAGHEPPLLFHKSTGLIEIVETSGMAAGIDEGPVFKRSVKDYRFQMESGDILLLYTDGLIESVSTSGEEFGIERLCEMLIAHREESAQNLVNSITAEADRFTAGTSQMDDITLIAIEKR